MIKELSAINNSPDDFLLKPTAFEPVDEELVDISEYSAGEILVDMQYYKMNIDGAISKAYVRKVARRISSYSVGQLETLRGSETPF